MLAFHQFMTIIKGADLPLRTTRLGIQRPPMPQEGGHHAKRSGYQSNHAELYGCIDCELCCKSPAKAVP